MHLSLVNGGSAETVRIRIAKEGGAQVREVKVEGEGAALSTELEALAGVYTQTEVAHGRVFRLTVNAPRRPRRRSTQGRSSRAGPAREPGGSGGRLGGMQTLRPGASTLPVLAPPACGVGELLVLPSPR